MLSDKKTYGAVLLAIILVMTLVYFSFIRKGSSDLSSGQASDLISPARKLFPSGTEVDMSALNDQRFSNLVAPRLPVVNKSEIGNPNPFDLSAYQPSSTAPQPAPALQNPRPRQ